MRIFARPATIAQVRQTDQRKPLANARLLAHVDKPSKPKRKQATVKITRPGFAASISRRSSAAARPEHRDG
jgi:hypothetical protein